MLRTLLALEVHVPTQVAAFNFDKVLVRLQCVNKLPNWLIPGIISFCMSCKCWASWIGAHIFGRSRARCQQCSLSELPCWKGSLRRSKHVWRLHRRKSCCRWQCLMHGLQCRLPSLLHGTLCTWLKHCHRGGSQPSFYLELFSNLAP